MPIIRSDQQLRTNPETREVYPAMLAELLPESCPKGCGARRQNLPNWQLGWSRGDRHGAYTVRWLHCLQPADHDCNCPTCDDRHCDTYCIAPLALMITSPDQSVRTVPAAQAGAEAAVIEDTQQTARRLVAMLIRQGKLPPQESWQTLIPAQETAPMTNPLQNSRYYAVPLDAAIGFHLLPQAALADEKNIQATIVYEPGDEAWSISSGLQFDKLSEAVEYATGVRIPERWDRMPPLHAAALLSSVTMEHPDRQENDG